MSLEIICCVKVWVLMCLKWVPLSLVALDSGFVAEPRTQWEFLSFGVAQWVQGRICGRRFGKAVPCWCLSNGAGIKGGCAL